MLGLLGAILFGTVYTGAWLHEDEKEGRHRKNSRENGIPFYYDKFGNMRHVGSGIKYTIDEIEAYFHRGDQQKKDLNERRYYLVICSFKYHVFNSYNDALQFIELSREKGEFPNDKPLAMSKKFIIERGIKYIYHFDEGWNTKEGD